MGSLATGGGSGAVAASAHAGCPRFRATDPMWTGRSRRALAEQLGHPDTTAGIPEARWMRAMTFERLLRNESNVSRLVTSAHGRVELPRPQAVRRADAKVSRQATRAALETAHRAALEDGASTFLTSLSVPFFGLPEDKAEQATDIRPDFAVVAPRRDSGTVVGSWLVMGDAKDYERVRSRIGDNRLLKGFLQVALGAEAAKHWAELPAGMVVHERGVLAVPRNSFLQPTIVAEELKDHRREVWARVTERVALLTTAEPPISHVSRSSASSAGSSAPVSPSDVPDDVLVEWVNHIEAVFDPQSCSTCSLFNLCRDQLRSSDDPESLLVELGIAAEDRPALIGLLDGSGTVGGHVSQRLADVVRATRSGRPVRTGRLRADPVGEPGTVDVVLAKSDSATLGVHGMALRATDPNGNTSPWSSYTFSSPQAPATRRHVMRLLGEQLTRVMTPADSTTGLTAPIHLIVPDFPTADLLVSIADSLAGIEINRLRWTRDLEMGRTPLTYDGEPVEMPEPLDEAARLAVSFLLEEDRARAFVSRTPVVVLRDVLAFHLVPGGPLVDAGRLDLLTAWASAGPDTPIDHRAVADAIADSPHTPGARLANATSDAIHRAMPKPGRSGRLLRTSPEYRRLITEELHYKTTVVDQAVEALSVIPASATRAIRESFEGSAQAVWRRRLAYRANDLVRFGRTNRLWRNNQVELFDSDATADRLCTLLADTCVATDAAHDASVRDVALARVVATNPLQLEVASRRIGEGTTAMALHVNGQACIEHDTIQLKDQKGSVQLRGMPTGVFEPTDDEDDPSWYWTTTLDLDAFAQEPIREGTEILLLLDVEIKQRPAGAVNIDRPTVDASNAPKATCTDDSYYEDPEGHRHCCQNHESREAGVSDFFAEQRAQGLMNPEVWPPLVDTDGFDVATLKQPAVTTVDETGRPPTDLTMDDLD